MNTLRLAVVALLCSSLPASAANRSIYSGLARGSAIPPLGPVGVLSAARAVEGVREAPAAAAAQAAAAPAVAAEISAAAFAPAMGAGAAALGREIEAGRLDVGALFDKRSLAAADSFVEQAIQAFHPSLPVGKAPGVAGRLGPTAEGGIPTDQEMEARMRMSPLTNPEREAAVIKLYQMGGAAAEVVEVPKRQSPRFDLYDTIQTQDAGRGRRNFIVVKKGRTDRVVVVGAHHDKVHEGAGTIDNWTGATMVTNLYQAMKDVDTDATFVFVAFSREEEGLLGSRFFVDSLTAAQKAKLDSMVNLDTLGVDGTFSWKNNSDRSMLDRVMQVAKADKRDLKEIVLHGGDGDSSTFRRILVAAFTLFGASPEVIWDIIHSGSDTIAAFSLPHYRNAYLLTLALLKSLDAQPIKPKPTAV